MRNKYVNYSAPKLPRCFGCARLMHLVRRTPRFGELRDVYTFECRACGVWHIEEADALEGGPADRGAVLAVSAHSHNTPATRLHG